MSFAAAPLHGRRVDVFGIGSASRYAVRLLATLGAEVRERGGASDEHPALGWARSGLMGLTGLPAGRPQMAPVAISACADGVFKALASLGARPRADGDGAAQLAARAALLGLRRAGAVSAGGSCRLLATGDGMLALSLARAEDWALVPAWLEGALEDDRAGDWGALAQQLAGSETATLLERARLLGLPAAAAAPCPPGTATPSFAAAATSLPPVADPSFPCAASTAAALATTRGGAATGADDAAAPWCAIRRLGAARHPEPGRAPLVVDLSALWAGPLCGQILHRLGARVVKVESTRRPDGARRGMPAFFDLMNAGKASVALDFSRPAELARLRALLRSADIVIESSRPRALRQLGIDAEALLAERPGLTWLSITGYGRDEPQANWAAFGDDAGVAGGLSTLLATVSGQWLFCADAIGDPLTGLHAALAAWSTHLGGGGCLVALAMQDVVAHCARWELPLEPEALQARWQRWTQRAWEAGLAGCRPRRPPMPGPARPLGADTVALFAEFERRGRRC